ncbi:MAG TPA: response regulator, partial [Chloroflexota bacterium]|nr:response regulator [Chloroflexota bacterium]
MSAARENERGAVQRRLLTILERLLVSQAADSKGSSDLATQSGPRHAAAPERSSISQINGQRILLVDGESELRDTVRAYLELQGFIVLQATDAVEAMAKVRTALPDLVVLDVTAPEMDAIAALREIRAITGMPIIMLTSRDDEDDIVQALRLGADDYVTKPFSHREFLARIESVLRRTAQIGTLSQETLVFDDDLTLDFARNRVILRGAARTLTATEHRLLYHLVSNAGRLMPYETLLARVWGPEYREEVHYVRLYVSYLRGKIEPEPAHPRYILTEKGLGYRFAAELEHERGGAQNRQQFAGMGAHELNTLVAAITAYTGVLLQRPERARESDELCLLYRVEAQAARVLDLIDELVDLRHLQSGVLTLEAECLDLAALAADTVGRLQAMTQMHHLTVDAEQHILVRADRRRLEGVLVKLLEN